MPGLAYLHDYAADPGALQRRVEGVRGIEIGMDGECAVGRIVDKKVEHWQARRDRLDRLDHTAAARSDPLDTGTVSRDGGQEMSHCSRAASIRWDRLSHDESSCLLRVV